MISSYRREKSGEANRETNIIYFGINLFSENCFWSDTEWSVLPSNHYNLEITRKSELMLTNTNLKAVIADEGKHANNQPQWGNVWKCIPQTKEEYLVNRAEL